MNNNTESVPGLLKILWSEGFFSAAKDIAQVSGGLAANGYNVKDSNLGVALMRSVRAGGFLIRIRKNSKWKYIQKHPASSVSGQRTEIFSRYDFHTRIKEVSFKQFEDGYFKEAVQNALVEVIDQVKVKTKHPKNANGKDLDGDDLMNHIFGCDNQKPRIKFNKLKTGLDKAEQRGIMNLFKGIVGIRDRKAHLNYIQNDPLKTIEYLGLASLLLRLLDENTSTLKSKK